MVDYVLPTGVRIADADRVRLGAHLAAGTTVMHEGFVNYNAGTLGASMVEGRISAGVVVGDGSDVGGGASIMGTLSGGGKEVISIGERCLLGANAGIGISLGDDCVVEAGCYVTAGTKVTVTDIDHKPQVVKAAELSGRRQRALPPQLGHAAPSRPCRGRARASPSTPRCTPTDGRRVRRRTGAALVVAAVLAVVAVIGRRPCCTTPARPPPRAARPRSAGTRSTLTTEQAENAALIAAISVQRGMPARAASIALATAYQESKLYNLEYGDRDSLGLFQQRPSQGWGTRRAGHRPLLRDQRVLRRAGAGRRLRDDARSPWPPRRCSARATPRRTPTTRPTPGRSPPR